MNKKFLITGTAGFIGFHLAKKLLSEGNQVLGFDGITPYYSVKLKLARLEILKSFPGFAFEEGMLEDEGLLVKIADEFRPDVLIHLAAQAGVRYSIEEPRSYVASNLVGTHEVLEAARHCNPSHLLLASTSSVYGANITMPYKETTKAVHPMSFYASTKIANEAMAHSYSHLYSIPTTMFRFFTVYGPWGRPDMALFKFTKAIVEGKAIDVYNNGDMRRDFTFIDDLIETVGRLVESPPGKQRFGASDSLSPVAPFRVINIGNSSPSSLCEFIVAIENSLGKKAEQNLLPMQPGDVPATWSDTTLLRSIVGDLPHTPLQVGVEKFVKWFQDWDNVV